MKIYLRCCYHLCVYVLTQWVVRFIFKLVWRVKIKGMENIPEKGSFLLASNHISLADPPLIGCIVRREIFFFAKEDLYIKLILKI